jgi:hypothetical protein
LGVAGSHTDVWSESFAFSIAFEYPRDLTKSEDTIRRIKRPLNQIRDLPVRKRGIIVNVSGPFVISVVGLVSMLVAR